MSNIKNVVKVMNFHALLRVDSARKTSTHYAEVQVELTRMIRSIFYNRNFILDKKIVMPSSHKKQLNIYIGSDFGFCGNFNSIMNQMMKQDSESDLIIVGSKMMHPKQNVLLRCTKETFFDHLKEIEALVFDSIVHLKHSQINVIYTHYYNVNSLKPIVKTVFPMTIEKEASKKYQEDFVVEGDITNILIELISLYVLYEIKAAEAHSWAAENVLREQITRESLTKIDELESEKQKAKRKQVKQENFKKIIEDFSHMRQTEGGAAHDW